MRLIVSIRICHGVNLFRSNYKTMHRPQLVADSESLESRCTLHEIASATDP